MVPGGREFCRVGFLREVGGLRNVIRLHEDLRRRAFAGPADDVLVGIVGTVDVEDQQVGLEGIEVGLRRLHEHLRGEPAQRPVFNDEIGVRKALAQIVLHPPRPFLFGDALAVEQDAYGVAVFGCAGGEQTHGALDVSAPPGGIRELEWRIGQRLRSSRSHRQPSEADGQQREAPAAEQVFQP